MMKKASLCTIFAKPIFALICGLTLLLASCNNLEDSNEDSQASLTLSHETMTINGALGGFTQGTITATLTGSNAALSWYSTNTGVATVSAEGNVATVLCQGEAGTSKIGVRTADGALEASCMLTVTLSLTPASPVSDVSVAENSETAGGFTLTWKDPAISSKIVVDVFESEDARTEANALAAAYSATEPQAYKSYEVALGVQTLVISDLLTDATGKTYYFSVYGFLNGKRSTEAVNGQATLSPDSTAPQSVSAVTSTALDHSITLSWTEPADEDYESVTVSISPATDFAGNALSEASQTISKGTVSATFESLSAACEYAFTFKTADCNGNSQGDENNAEAAGLAVTVTTAADVTSPEAVTDLSAAVGRDNVTLFWTGSASKDVKGYNAYVKSGSGEYAAVESGNLTVTASENAYTAQISNLTVDTAYTFKVTAFDYESPANESAGVDITATPTIPTASAVSVSQQYTGSLLVSWTDTAASETNAGGEALTYTYSVTCTANGSEVETKEGIASGVQQAHFTGLTVGQEYSFTVTVVDSESVTCGTTAAVTGTPETVIWQIKNQFNSGYWSEAVTSDGSYITHVANSSSQPYQYWLVRPALDGVADVSFEATDITGTPTGLFWYFDMSGTRGSAGGGTGTTKRGFVGYLNKEDGAYVSVQNGSKTAQGLECASFYLTESTSTASTFDGFSAFHWITVVSGGTTYCVDNDWYVDSLVAFSSQTGNQYNWAYKQAASVDVDYFTDAPAAPVAGTATANSASSVTLTWTNPDAVDFSHVAISSDDFATSVTATGSPATIKNLTVGTTYTFKIKAYDVYGNESSAVSFESVTTASESGAPSEVTATAGYTGQIVVTWTDATAPGSYTYTVTATTGGETVATKTDVAHGTGKAVFNGLTVGTEYTFAVTSNDGETDYAAEATASATARKVLWRIRNGQYPSDARYITPCILTEEPVTVSGQSLYSDAHVCITNTTQAAGTASGGNYYCDYSYIAYTHWLVYPALDNTDDAISFMASDANGTVSDYWLYLDDGTTRTVPALTECYQAAWWTTQAIINAIENKAFVAKLDGSDNNDTKWFTDMSRASFIMSDSSYTATTGDGFSSTKNFKATCNLYLYDPDGHTQIAGVSSISEAKYGAFWYLETILTE